MMVEVGVRLYFVDGLDKNIKLTSKDDPEMFKGYLKANVARKCSARHIKRKRILDRRACGIVCKRSRNND